MALASGTRLGAYEIVSLLGAGGMGEVYRARDSRLNRDVAIKILRDAFAMDAEHLARFKREAQVLASLNHPHIAAVYGVEEGNGIEALVMELVEGATLDDRIKRGPLPVDEALPIAKQIAEALEGAHDQGIVHRDLKPANIKLRADGVVKVLDFGLAKAIAPVSTVGVSATTSSTASPHAMTQAGVILGTPAYMAPEQAKGRAADKRSDMWSYGCTVYEMLTAQRAFGGEDFGDVLANILKTDPDWSALPEDTPRSIVRLLRRCLAKDRRERLSDASVARLEIDEGAFEPSKSIRTSAPPFQRRERIVWIAVAGAALAIAAGAWLLRVPPSSAEVRFEIATPETPSLASFALAPGGQRVVFAATADGQARLWLRAFDSIAPRPLAGTEDGRFPFWSPDGHSLGFFSDGKLRSVNVDGGPVRTLANAVSPGGGTWSRSGTIIYSPNVVGALVAISQDGGEPRALTGLVQPAGHRAPQLLPDDRHFLYSAVGSDTSTTGVFIGDLRGDASFRVVEADEARYGANHLIFVKQRTLFAQPFDPRTFQLTGAPFFLADRIAAASESGRSLRAFSVAGPGAIAYRAASGAAAAGLRQLAWSDRTGARLESVGEPMIASTPALAADGRHLAFQRVVNGNTDVWTVDLTSGRMTRLTSSNALDGIPLWSPDGTRVAFASVRDGASGVYVASTENGNETFIAGGSSQGAPVDWSHDGRFILYRRFTNVSNLQSSQTPAGGNTELWALPLDDNAHPFAVVRSDAEVRDGQFSPDDKWVAYQSDESGRPEIYVQRFPGPGGKQVVSTAGGSQVRWRADGRELFYVALDGWLMAVPMRTAGQGDPSTVEAGTPTRLFATGLSPPRGFSRQQYVVSPDGQRFLVSFALDSGGLPDAPITVILNWKPDPLRNSSGPPP